MRRTGSPRPPSSGPIAASSAVGDAAELLDAALDGATGAADAAQSGDYAKYTAAIRSGAIPTVAGTTGGRAVAGCSRTTCRGDCLYRVLNAVGIDDLTRIFNTTAKLKQKFKPRTGTGVVGGGGGIGWIELATRHSKNTSCELWRAPRAFTHRTLTPRTHTPDSHPRMDSKSYIAFIYRIIRKRA